MTTDLKALGLRRTYRLLCDGFAGRSCELGELWRGDGLVAVRTYRRPGPAIVRLGYEAKASGLKRAPTAVELVVLLNLDGTPASTDPEAWGLDPDAEPPHDDQRWQRLALAFHGKPFADPIHLWCWEHRAGLPMRGRALASLPTRRGTTTLKLPAR